MPEIQFDGLVGPTHNYAGLSRGNAASTLHEGRESNPRAAARQGLSKMSFVRNLGVVQAVLPPHDRPSLSALRRLGFYGSDEEVLAAAATADGGRLLRACSSASAMWTANARRERKREKTFGVLLRDGIDGAAKHNQHRRGLQHRGGTLRRHLFKFLEGLNTCQVGRQPLETETEFRDRKLQSERSGRGRRRQHRQRHECPFDQCVSDAGDAIEVEVALKRRLQRLAHHRLHTRQPSREPCAHDHDQHQKLAGGDQLARGDELSFAARPLEPSARGLFGFVRVRHLRRATFE